MPSLTELKPPALHLVFHRDAIEVLRYPFSAASVKQGSRITPDMIAKVRLLRWPPEIVLTSGEILFVDYNDRVFLEYFAKQHAIPTAHEVDVWSHICEPFLDTEFSEQEQHATSETLGACGFMSVEVEDIRNRIGSAMNFHNAIAWECMHLGQFEVLQWYGKGGCGSGWKIWQRRREQRAFYALSHQIAVRTIALPEQEYSVSMRADSLIGEAIRDVAFHFMKAAEHWAYVGLGEKIAPMIYDAYGSLDRQYHNLLHIAQMLHISDGFALSKRDRAVLRCAILFHDIVYDPRAHDNEERSAALMRSLLAGKGDHVDDVEEVARLILFTKDYARPKTRLEQCMADADLAMFADEGKVYQRHVMNIRREFSHVDELTWRQGRLAFLVSLKEAARLRNGRLYHLLPPMYEAQAQRNLDTEIAQWQSLVAVQVAA